MTVNNPTYSGEFVRELNTALVLGGGDASLLRVVEAVKDKTNVKRFDYVSSLKTGNMCSPVKTSGSSTTDIVLETLPFYVYEEYCKDNFLGDWYDRYQRAGTANTEVPQEILQAELMQMASVENKNLRQIRWSGNTAVAPAPAFAHLALQDGVCAQLQTLGTFIPAGSGGLNATNIFATLSAIVSATPDDVLSSGAFRLILSMKAYKALVEAAAPNIGQLNQNPLLVQGIQNPMMSENGFIGNFVQGMIPMHLATGLVDQYDEVILGYAAEDSPRNPIVFGTDATADMNTITVHDRQSVNPNDRYIEFSWYVRQGIAIARAEQIVAWNL